MEATDRTRFAEMLAGLASVFNRPLDRPTIELYFRALADLDVRDVAAGCQDCLRNLQFFPKPAEIRERAFGGDGEADQMPPARYALPPARYPGMRQECAEMLASFSAGKYSLEALQAWMRDMEPKYPGLNWAEEAEQLTPVIATAGGINARYAPHWWGDVVEIGRTPLDDPIVRRKDFRGAVSQMRTITLDVLVEAAKRDLAAEKRALAELVVEEVPF